MTPPDAKGSTTIGAAGRFVPVRAYDAIMGLIMRERRWRGALAADLARQVPADGHVLEIGAGTGSLSLVLRDALPQATITAVDPDPAALKIAQNKPGAQGVDWQAGRAEALALADASQDAVVMALMLHHLAPAAKRLALAEAARVLRPGGRLYVADFARPQDPLMSAAFAVIQLADGRGPTALHRVGGLSGLLAEAGFVGGDEPVLRLRTGGGTLEVLGTRLT